MKKKIFSIIALSVAMSACAGEVYDIHPVSEPCNPMYLKGLANRPWWNDDWQYRLPIVISESSTNNVPVYVADFLVDLGKPGMAESVRVITDYGEELPCFAEEVRSSKFEVRSENNTDPQTSNVEPRTSNSSTTVRIQFKTSLDALENKCFFVYYGNPKAKRVEFPEEVLRSESDDFFTLRNAFLTLDFAKETRGADVLRRFKVNGSPAISELTYVPGRNCADRALRMRLGGDNGEGPFTNRIAFASSSPFKRQIVVENDDFESIYTLYADSTRLDYIFRRKPDSKRFFSCLTTSLAPGQSRAWDDLVYPSLSGAVRSDRAQLDYRSDGAEPIRHEIDEWSKEGWFAISDRGTAVSVGFFYTPANYERVRQGEWSGHTRCHAIEMVIHGGNRDNPLNEVRGALFGTFARADLIRDAYRVWANPPRVITGKSEPRRKIEAKHPDMAHDFCSSTHIGADWGSINSDNPKNAELEAKKLAIHLRKGGFNCGQLASAPANWWNWGPDQKLFEEIKSIQDDEKYDVKEKCKQDWNQSERNSRNMKAFLDAFHAYGCSAFHWGQFLFGSNVFLGNEHARELEIQAKGVDNAKIGFDGTWCHAMGREGPLMYEEYWGTHSGKFWKWKERADREKFFEMQDIRLDHVRRYCEAVRKAGGHPLAWGCDLGLLSNEQLMLECAGDFDIVIEELMTGKFFDRNERNRFGSARMRAMFNNEPHTVWTHFWSRIAGDDIRVGNCDLPFIFGVNGFNQESDSYSQVDPEIVNCHSKFFRWAHDTGMAEISPKFTPVKYYNLFRDQRDHRADCIEGRYGRKMKAHGWDDVSDTDAVANYWTSAILAHTDLTLNRYFTLENLKRYPVLLLPHNYCITEKEFDIVKKYVEEGGVCYAEGEKFPFAKFFTDGAKVVDKEKGFVSREYGKGKLLYSTKESSLVWHYMWPGGHLRGFIVKETGCPEPLKIIGEDNYLKVDGMLRTDGKNYIFGSFARDLPGGTSRVVRAKFNVPFPEGKKLFALDMKSGKRTPFDGTLEFLQRQNDCCQYLVGDEEFTSVPEYTVCPQAEFGAIREGGVTGRARKRIEERDKLGDFKRPVALILFQEPGGDGKVGPNPSITRGLFEQVLFSSANYDAKEFRETLKRVKMLQLRDLKTETVEMIFKDNADALKEFLKAGGTIMFDRSPSSEAAGKFLKSVGVFDVAATRSKKGDYWGERSSTVDKKHPLFCSPHDTNKHHFSRLQASYCYQNWDKDKQVAPIVISERDRPDKSKDYAMCVCQENVLGAGKVIFHENTGAFTTWYEDVRYSDNLTSYALDINLFWHKTKVFLLNGGYGEEVKFPELIRNGF